MSKLTRHNPNTIGCIVNVDGAVYHNLPELYEMVDVEGVTEHISNVFTLTEGLDETPPVFEQLFIEHNNHSIFARRIQDGVLITLNKPMPRKAFKKIQVGVNLFVKPLERAVAAGPEDSAPLAAPPKERAEPPKQKAAAPKRMYRGVEY
ncbi:MAG: hypothetical protein AAGH74_10980 [Pseudomonadota bacterium]